jgi:hypothetical protein
MRLPTPREPECSIEPHAIALVEADLDEVVAGAQRAEVVDVVAAAELGVLSTSSYVAGSVGGPGDATRAGAAPPRAAIVAPAVVAAAVRHRGLDRRAHAVQVVGQVAGGERGLDRHHAAADVDADRGRDDRSVGGDHAADRRADAPVDVGHRGDVVEHDRQLGHVLELAPGRRLELHAVHPGADRHAVGLDQVVLHGRSLPRARRGRATRSHTRHG